MCSFYSLFFALHTITFTPRFPELVILFISLLCSYAPRASFPCRLYSSRNPPTFFFPSGVLLLFFLPLRRHLCLFAPAPFPLFFLCPFFSSLCFLSLLFLSFFLVWLFCLFCSLFSPLLCCITIAFFLLRRLGFPFILRFILFAPSRYTVTFSFQSCIPLCLIPLYSACSALCWFFFPPRNTYPSLTPSLCRVPCSSWGFGFCVSCPFYHASGRLLSSRGSLLSPILRSVLPRLAPCFPLLSLLCLTLSLAQRSHSCLRSCLLYSYSLTADPVSFCFWQFCGWAGLLS